MRRKEPGVKMNNKLKNGLMIGGGLAGVVIGGFLAVRNASVPSTTYEVDMLNGAAAYVERCDGNSSEKAKDALNYALEAMERASEKTTLEGLAEAKATIEGLAEDVQDSPKLYPLVLEKSAKLIENVAYRNDRSNFSLYTGVLLVLAGFGTAIAGFVKSRNP